MASDPVAGAAESPPATATPVEFAGRVALVTGGGKGIGRAISLELAGRGADVAINYRSDAAAAKQTAAAIRELGRRVALVPADLTEEGAPRRVVETARAELGPVALLVNNAAYTRLIAPEQLTVRLWRRMFAANVEAAFELMWLVREDMRALGGGGIVNISSTSSLRPDPSMIAYGASKAALNALTASAALAFAGDGSGSTLSRRVHPHAACRHRRSRGSGHDAGRGSDGPLGGAGGDRFRGSLPALRCRQLRHRSGPDRGRRPLRFPRAG
jgi:NAD(P)-dependent dehydrogenase (short-subunit alcohol dehydrogenase family)